MTIEKFLNEEVVNFASYSTLRAIGSLVDGQKNAGRKVIYTVKKRPTKDTKVSILSGIIMIETEYLHGDISGSIVTLAQNYSGTNNIPLLTREGNFGSRFEHDASATRYIFTGKEKYLDKFFIKDDEDVLIKQEFEGTKIEPMFYVPTLPLIALNGSKGIATGFAQKILSRNPEEVSKYIKEKINNKTITADLTPWFKDFRGIIEQGDNETQWLIKGKIERISGTIIKITELPPSYNLTSYTKVLDTLEDKKIIKSYIDNSEDDIFNFEIKTDMKFTKHDDNWILNTLKLIKKESENFTVIDEYNIVQSYNSIEEVLNHYIEVKKNYLYKRKSKKIENIIEYIKELASKYLFIKNIVEGNIIVNKKSKTEIITQLDTFDKIIKKDDSYDYLLRMPIYSLTMEKMNELLENIKIEKSSLEYTKNTSIETTWENEIDDLIKVIKE